MNKANKKMSAAWQVGFADGKAWAKTTEGPILPSTAKEGAKPGLEGFDNPDSKLDYSMGFRAGAFDVALARTLM